MASTSTKKETFKHFHRFETRCYETASGFQTVWRPLTDQANPRRMKNITTLHLYFLSKILQDGLLTHKLNQAVAAMVGLSGKCEKIIELFCLAGLEVLKNIPQSDMLILKFYKNMFLACADHKQEILLNFALYLVLKQRHVAEGLELLKSKSDKKPFSDSLMHKAYIALFEHILHQPKKNERAGVHFHGLETFESDDDEDDIFNTQMRTSLGFSSKRSMILFEEVFSTPGVWDTFIPAYIEIVSNNQGVNAVQKLLEEYRNKNPCNPNAHRYLYHFSKSNSASDQELIKILEDLLSLDSTSEYFDDLVKLKVKSGDMKNVVQMLFEKLDHSACTFDEKSWNLLKSYLNDTEGEGAAHIKSEIESCWKIRQSWWPSYHFRLSRNFKFSEEIRSVMLCKARVAEHFLGIGNNFTKEVRKKYGIFEKDEGKLSRKRTLSVNSSENGSVKVAKR